MVETAGYRAVLQQINSSVEPTAFAEYVHELLVDTTLNSIAENQVPELVVRAVTTELWASEYAIRLANRITDERRKVRMYAALLSIENLSEPQRQQVESAAFDTVSVTEYADSRFHLLLELAQFHTLRPQLHVLALNKALDLALELDAGEPRYQSALWTLVPLLTGNLLSRAAENIGTIQAPNTRAWACASLGRQLTGEQRVAVLGYGVDAALAIQDELHQANALAQLGDQLTGNLLEQAFHATLTMENEQWRPRVLEKLAGQLNAAQKARALEATLLLQHPWYRAFALAGLLPYLAGDLFTQALEAALSVESDEARALVMNRIAFSHDVLPRVLDIAMGMADEKYRFEALVGLIPQLERAQKQNALDSAFQFVTARLTEKPSTLSRYPYLMSRLAEQLEGTQRSQLLSDTLETVLHIPDEEDRGYALGALIEHLPDDLMPRVVEGALALEEDFRRIRVLGALANRLPMELLKQALAGSARANDYDARARALIKLSRLLSGPAKAKALQYALQAALTIQAAWERIEPLGLLLNELDDPQRTEATVRALETALILPNNGHKVDQLTALLPFLEARQRDAIFAIARDAAEQIEDTETHSRALVALAANTKGEEKDDLLALAFEESLRVRRRVEPYLPVIPISEQTLRGAAVAYVATHLTGDLLTRALVFFQQNEAPFWQIRMVLETTFTRQQFETALALVSQIANAGCRAEALAILAQQASEGEKTRMLTQVLELAKIEPIPSQRFRILILLATQVDGDQQAEVIDLALASVSQIEDKVPLDFLLQLLPFGRNRERLVREIRKAVLEALELQRSKPRQDLLYFFDDESLALPIFAASTVAAIVDHIIAVCWPDYSDS